MSRASGNGWDHENTIPVQFRSQNERPGSDHHNSIPIHFTSTGDLRPQPSSFRQASLDPRLVATHGGWPFQDTHSRFPFETNPPVCILVIRSMARESGPRTTPFSSNPPTRFPPQLREPVATGFQETKLEQEKALKTLRRQIYSSDTKTSTRRLSLFNRNMAGKGKESDEGSTRCSVCLEDFEAGNEVMVTQCNHVFHEGCIVPWMKSNGQCPVCRFVVSEQLKANAMAVSNASVPPPALLEQDDGRFISEHVLSVIRAMDGAFSWGRAR